MSLRSCLLALSILLTLACGGGGKTTYPGPESITLTVEEPMDGALAPSSRLTLYGRVSQKDAVVACNDQPVFVDASGLFQTVLSLNSGENQVTLKAWSAEEAKKGRGSNLLPLGQVATTLIRKVVFNGPSLTLKVNAPAEGAHFAASRIAVSGSVSDAATVTLNGNAMAVADSGCFQGTLDLQPGANALVFLAKASGGRNASETRNVVYDPPAPGTLQVGILAPAEGLITHATTVEVTGTLSDPTATLALNGQAIVPKADGTWSLTLSPPEGNLTLLATASKAGVNAQDTRSLVIDRTPPHITLNNAPAAELRTSALSLVGSVDDPSAFLRLAGQALPLSAMGVFSTQVALNQGANTLHFVAVDPAGNLGTLDLTVSYAPTSDAPRVVFDTPLDGYATSSTSVLVKGHVDDPSATLILQGEQIATDPLGYFERLLRSSKLGVMAVRAEATNAHGTGKAGLYVTFDQTPPLLVWAEPTPAQGSQLSSSGVSAAVLINKAAITTINGERTELEPSGDAAMPFKASAELSLQEGQVVLTAKVVDASGNEATITRELALGLTAPSLVLDAPVFDNSGIFSTANLGVTLTGSVSAPDAVKPLALALNGHSVPLGSDGRFSIPMALALGANPVSLVATNAFKQSDTKIRSILRTPGIPDAGEDVTPGIRIDWPQDGFAAGTPQVKVMGHVLVPGMSATLNGAPVAVDPQTLAFTGTVTLAPGNNTIQAMGTDAQKRMVSTQIQGRYLTKDSVTYTWLSPLDGARSKTRSLAITGKAEQPGILSLTVNDVPMTLDPLSGTFSGQVSLAAKGRNALLLQATTLGGELLNPERREVIFQPDLPLIRLTAPETARPGATVALQVLPETGTQLVSADLSIDGRLIAHMSPPFAVQEFTIPSDAVVGRRIPVDAIGTDAEGETVTARATITVYDTGALLQKVLDDRTGLPVEGVTVAIENGESGLSDASGRVALTTALPANWIKVSKTGYTSVWRSAALKRSGVEASLDARLTSMEAAQAAPATFAKGAIELQGAGSVSATPLSSQGLPGLLPAGWSAVSACWMTVEAPATTKLKLDAALPAGGTYVWARWDETQHLWIVMVPAANATSLSVPQSGGYALLMPDPAPNAPPAAVEGQALPAFQGNTWSEGFVFTTGDGPTTLSTAEAINGARIEAFLKIGFKGKAPIPSGTVIQGDLLESYTLVDAKVIEPESFTQDLLAHRWALTVVDGAPVLESAGEGLLLKPPVRMSRTFKASELVQGRLRVGFYHDGIRVADSGSGLLSAAGGTLSHDGITISLPAGAVSGSALVSIQSDSGDLMTLWPELSGKGTLKQSFQIDVVGTLLKGLGLSLDTLDVPETARPLVLQRRVVQGQRLVVAVGELKKSVSTWSLVTPAGGNPVMEGGAFSVLLPSVAWDWISGTTTMPEAAASSLIQKRGAKAGMRPMTNASIPVNPRPSPAISSLSSLSSSSAPSVSVSDVKVDAGYLLAASGTGGAFAVPAPTAATPATVNGSRWDLGLTGSFSALVPSTGNSLVLATVPFVVETLLPSPGSPIPPAAAFQVITTGPCDAASIANAKVFKEDVEITLRRSLAQDGRTLLLTPEQPLVLGASYRLVIDGLLGLSGDTAPKVDQSYQVQAPAAAPSPVDFSRIKLSYPDASFNVTVTIPQGAIPARSKVEVEAPGMGSVGTATMPDSGEQVFTLKASLGERLKIQAQLADGRVVTGYLSRYEAGDGTGRVTLGVDGGRIEAVDGSGAAVNLPVGAIDRPVEFKARMVTDIPEDLLPESAVPAWGRVQLLAREHVVFTKIPRIEAPAPEGAVDLGELQGFGTYPVCFRNTIFDSEGQPASVWEFLDTAKVEGGRLQGLGGLPWSSSAEGTDVEEAPEVSLQVSSGAMAIGKSMAQPKALSAAAGVETVKCPVGMSDYPMPQSSLNGSALYDMLARLGFAYGGGSSYSEEFVVELDGMIVKNPGKVIYKGRAWTKLEGVARRETVGAPVFYSAGEDVSVKGRIVGRTSQCGTYMVMNALFADDPLQEGGSFLGVEPDFGISQVRQPLSSPWMDDRKNDRKLFQVPAFEFEVKPHQMGDFSAPWGQMAFEGPGKLGAEDFAAGFYVDIVVAGRDNVDKDNINVEVRLDGEPAPRTTYSSFMGILSRTWKVRWQPGAGRHWVDAYLTDKVGNVTHLRREIRLIGVDTTPGRIILGEAPAFTVEVDGGLDTANPDTFIKVVFSELVSGVDASALRLYEFNEDSLTWGRVAGIQVLGATGAVTEEQKVQNVLIIPPDRLRAGGTYKLYADNSILDFDSPPKPLQNSEVTIKVAPITPFGTGVSVGSGVLRVAAVGSRMFMAQGSGIKTARLKDGELQGLRSFGPRGDGSNFFGQDLTALRAYSQVNIGNGQKADLLIATTQASGANYNQQGVLWGFDACTLELKFAVSIGQGAAGYAPSVDQRDGVIVVGRLSSSLLIVDVVKAIEGWEAFKGNPQAATYPVGANAGAIIQSMYLADPDYWWQDGDVSSATGLAHWGVALVPGIAQSDQDWIRMVVGYSHPKAQFQGAPMTGLPSGVIQYAPGGTYSQDLPFLAESVSAALSKQQNAPPADFRAMAGPLWDTDGTSGKWAAKRIAVVPRITIEDGGKTWQTNLVVGFTSIRPYLKDPLTGAQLQPLGNGLAIAEKYGVQQVFHLATWPTEPPFGPEVPYEIPYAQPSVDETTGLVGVPVKNLKNGSVTWFVLDLSKPKAPRTVAKVNNLGNAGALENGVLFAVDQGGKARAYQVMKGVKTPAECTGSPIQQGCAADVPVDDGISIVSVDGELVTSQGHGYGNGQNQVPSRCYTISIPVQGASNTQACWFSLTLRRRSDITFQGLCLVAQTNLGESRIMTNQGLDSRMLAVDRSQPATNTNGVIEEHYLVNAAMLGNITSNLYRNTAPPLTYELVAYGTLPSDSRVRSARKTWVSSEQVAYRAGDEVPLWPLYRASAVYAERYGSIGPNSDWCAAGVFRFFANPANAALLAPYGWISPEHGGPRPNSKSTGHQLGTDIDFQNPGFEVLTANTSGGNMHNQVKNLLAAARGGDVQARERFQRWVNAARTRLAGYIGRPGGTVGQVMFGARANRSIVDVLQYGDDTLGISPWGIDLIDTHGVFYDNEKGGSHYHHFHVTFDPRFVALEH